MENKVAHVRGTQAKYDSLVTKDQDTYYICLDTGNYYLGSLKIEDPDMVKFDENNNIVLREGTKVLSTNNSGQTNELIGLGEYYVPIKITDIKIGDNLSGKTIIFEGDGIPDYDGNCSISFRDNTSGSGEYKGSLSFYKGSSTQIFFYFGSGNIYVYDNGWVSHSFTMPNDTDYIVYSNTIATAKPLGTWHFDQAYAEDMFVKQNEVGNKETHLNLNTTDIITVDTPTGKEELVYKSSIESIKSYTYVVTPENWLEVLANYINNDSEPRANNLSLLFKAGAYEIDNNYYESLDLTDFALVEGEVKDYTYDGVKYSKPLIFNSNTSGAFSYIGFGEKTIIKNIDFSFKRSHGATSSSLYYMFRAPDQFNADWTFEDCNFTYQLPFTNYYLGKHYIFYKSGSSTEFRTSINRCDIYIENNTPVSSSTQATDIIGILRNDETDNNKVWFDIQNSSIKVLNTYTGGITAANRRIVLFNHLHGCLSVSNTKFYVSGAFGGMIFYDEGSGSIKIKDCDFDIHIPTSNAFYLYNKTYMDFESGNPCYIKNCRVRINSDIANHNVYGLWGDEVSTARANMIIDNVVFQGRMSTNSGVAWFVNMKNVTRCSTVGDITSAYPNCYSSPTSDAAYRCANTMAGGFNKIMSRDYNS